MRRDPGSGHSCRHARAFGATGATVLAAALLSACATPPPDLTESANRAANLFGPQCESRGPTNTQAWGVCVAQAYNDAVAAHGGACDRWQLHAPSFADCVLNASERARAAPVTPASGPYCVRMNVGGGLDPSRCR
jgi:hypothetical protein